MDRIQHLQTQPTLVSGSAGCEKTMLAMEFLVQGGDLDQLVAIAALQAGGKAEEADAMAALRGSVKCGNSRRK